jgi:hypothetical protein
LQHDGALGPRDDGLALFRVLEIPALQVTLVTRTIS